jgi:hypothetical protein
MGRTEHRSNLYFSFCAAGGNQYIASEYAIEKINELVEEFRLKRILEVGLGIGSISGIILATNKLKLELKYSGTEAHDFCLKALSENLKENYNRLDIYSDLTKIPIRKKFDLIVVDGKDRNLQRVSDLISKHGVIAIEGDRMQQQDSLLEIFPNHKYVHCISRKKNKSYSPFPSSHWQGGLKIIFVNPNYIQKFWWIKEKIFIKLKYLLIR